MFYEWFMAILPDMYTASAAVITAAYLPQIIRLARAKRASDDLSLLAWWTWGVTATIAVLYGELVLHDWRFNLNAWLNWAGHVAILGLAIYNRYWRFKHPAE